MDLRQRRRRGIIWGCLSNPRRPALCGYGGRSGVGSNRSELGGPAPGPWMRLVLCRSGRTRRRPFGAALSLPSSQTLTRGKDVWRGHRPPRGRRGCQDSGRVMAWRSSAVAALARRGRGRRCVVPRGARRPVASDPILHHGSVAGTPSPRSLKESPSHITLCEHARAVERRLVLGVNRRSYKIECISTRTRAYPLRSSAPCW